MHPEGKEPFQRQTILNLEPGDCLTFNLVEYILPLATAGGIFDGHSEGEER